MCRKCRKIFWATLT